MTWTADFPDLPFLPHSTARFWSWTLLKGLKTFIKGSKRQLIIATGLLKQYIQKQYIQYILQYIQVYIQVVFYEIKLSVLL